MKHSDLESLKTGDKVFWTDPDHGFSSGLYDVYEVLTDSPDDLNEDTIIVINNEAGSYAEVYAHEIERVTEDSVKVSFLVEVSDGAAKNHAIKEVILPDGEGAADVEERITEQEGTPVLWVLEGWGHTYGDFARDMGCPED